MTNGRRERRERERGSSMIELCFTIPVLLIIAGATVDISRYMRYAQVTTFVSQEAASQIYRQCSDLTIYNRPVTNSSQLTIDTATTRSAIAQCIQRIQAASQLVLNRSLGSSAITSNVFRWQINAVNPNANCTNATSGEVTQIGVRGDTTPDLTETTQDPYAAPISNVGGVNISPVMINTSSQNTAAPAPLSSTTLSAIQGSSLTLGATGITQTGSTTPVITTQGICTRGRVVTVEVAYAFSPIVKFLPNMMIDLESKGPRRDISIF